MANNAPAANTLTGLDALVWRLDRCIGFFEDVVSISALCLMTLSVLVAVVLRYGLGKPNIMGEEISRYLFVTMVYIGISICARERTHMGVTIFVDHVPKRVQKPVRIVADLVTTATFVMLSWLGWVYVKSGLTRIQYSPATGIPIAVMYSVMAVGLTLSAIHFAMLFWNDYISKRHPLGLPKGAEA